MTVQSTMQHQMMGYDRSSTMFSPDGRLLQAEYAKKSVRRAATSLGIVCKDGVILLANKVLFDKLMVPEFSSEKIFQVDDHIGASATGFLMDARILIERAQVIAQQNRVTFDHEIDILTVVKDIANMKQAYTQYGGGRPFGVSFLFAGVDEMGPQLYVTDVTGIYFGYKATAIGEHEQPIKDFLDKKYKENMTIEQGLKLGIEAFKKAQDKDFDLHKIEGAIIDVKNKKFKRVTKKELQ
jgi:proteasome alpha subunit